MAEIDSLSLDGFDLGAALGIAPETEAEKKTPPPEQGGIKVSHRMGARQLWRKAALAQSSSGARRHPKRPLRTPCPPGISGKVTATIAFLLETLTVFHSSRWFCGSSP